MKKLDINKIPSCVVDEQKREQEGRSLRAAIRCVHEAQKKLSKESDIYTPASGEVSEWLRLLDYAKERQMKAFNAILTDDSIGDEDKREKVKFWKAWNARVVGHLNTIINAMEQYPQARWQFDKNIKRLVCGVDTIHVIESAASVPVPQDATEHAQLINAVAEAVESLRAWEREKGLVKTRLEILLSLDEKQLAERWASGSIMRNTEFDTPQTIATRDFYERQYV